ncbi:hypothetical protein OQA88_5015 [Cercophora sp. LCS_1]
MYLHNVVSAAAAISLPLAGRQSNSTVTLTVDLNQKFQTIDGFGFSEAFQRAYNIYNLPEPKRSQLVDLLFNTTSGAGFSIVRNGIGSSPNSSLDWMNTHLPRSPGSPDAKPEYVWDGKDSGQLWVSQQAVKYGVKTFYGNAWSAPGFMKTNNRDSNGGHLCGVPGTNCTTGDWRQAYADYLVKYIQFYGESGVNVTHIGFLNEPDFSTSYASMLSNGRQSASFIRVLHPTLEKANLGHVHITCCDATGWKAQINMTKDLVAEGVEPLIGVITSHPYSSAIDSPQPTKNKVWETEFSDLSGRWATDWYTTGRSGDGYTWANHIHTALTTGNVSAYLWWVATQDPVTNNNNNEKLILVDDTSYQVAKRFWAFAHYSRLIRPGATRIGVTSSDPRLRVTAFVNSGADGSVVVNIINTSATPTGVSISGIKAIGNKQKVWATDEGRDMAPVEADAVVVPARGLVSVLVIRDGA